jgi:hypothetical protein
MWLVRNKTAYSADRSWIQDKDANKIWLVAVKATFDITPNRPVSLAPEQVPVLRACEAHGELGRSSLVYEADLLGLKPSTDVLVNGHAWGPRGASVHSIDVQLTAGRIQKRLRVFGDRIWERSISGPKISGPLQFHAMPLTYERAYGGWDKTDTDTSRHRMDDRNPVGTGFAVTSNGCIGQRAPNIEYPSQLLRSWHDRPAPACFNAVDSAWTPRRQLAGTYDDAWRRSRFPLWAEDFDRRYANCAPTDQQAQGFMRGGEVVEVINMSEHGRLQFELPKVYPFFRTRFGREHVEHRAQLSTVIVEPDALRLMMVWQTSLICNHRVDELDETVVTEKLVM